MNYSDDKFILLADSQKNITEAVNERREMNYPRVENIDWSLNVTTATDKKQGIMEPHALLHLTLADRVTESLNYTNFDFSEEECTKFFEVLEIIQQKLDEVSEVKNEIVM